jgi:hypothetical protein
MSDLESAAGPILKPMLVGHEAGLTIDKQITIRAWIVLRAMILEHAGSARKARHYYTQDEHREFEQSLEPPDGIYLWLFYYRSRRWAARSNVANMGLHPSPTKSM